MHPRAELVISDIISKDRTKLRFITRSESVSLVVKCSFDTVTLRYP